MLLSADAGRRLEVLAAIDPLFLRQYFTAGTRGNAAPINTPLLIDGTRASYKGHSSTLNQYLHHGTCDGIISLVVVLLHINLVVSPCKLLQAGSHKTYAIIKSSTPSAVLSRQHSDLSGLTFLSSFLYGIITQS